MAMFVSVLRVFTPAIHETLAEEEFFTVI